jgi:Mn-dependent DtxR family transcriptional regulator
MTLADERILEFIQENGSGRPKAMSESGLVRFSRPYITQRCRELTERGLLQTLGNGVYVITEDGEAYLEGELDTADEQAPA